MDSLLKAGHPVDAVNASDGMTPLHLAMAQFGYWALECMTFLMNFDADVNALDGRGWTPLHYAVDGAIKDEDELRMRAVQKLTRSPASDFSIETPEGKTALQMARDAQRQDLIDCFTLT